MIVRAMLTLLMLHINILTTMLHTFQRNLKKHMFFDI